MNAKTKEYSQKSLKQIQFWLTIGIIQYQKEYV